MSLIQTPWTSQPQQAIGIDPRFGNAVAWIPGDVSGKQELRVTSGVSRLGTHKTGSEAPSGVSPSTAAYINFPNSAKYFGQKKQWFVIAGKLTSTGFTSYLSGCGKPQNNALAGNLSVLSTPSLEFATRTGGTWKAFSAPISRRSDLTFVAAYCIDDAGVLSLFWDGALVGQQSGWNSGIPTPDTDLVALMSYASAANSNLYGKTVSGSLIAFGNDGDVFSIANDLSKNPWQIFKPLPRRIFVPVVAGDPTLYPSLYTNTNSFYAPTVSVGDVTLTPSLFSNSNTFHSATVTLGGSTQTLTPSLYSNTNAFYGPSVSPGAVTLTPALFSNTNSFFGAVVTLDSDKILYPSLVSNSNSFYGPTVSVGAVSILPSLFVNSNTFYNHVVGGALTDGEKIDLILDILSNRQTLDATTGLYTLYADDGVTVLKTAQAWEDSEGTQPYRGRGLKRLDALQ